MKLADANIAAARIFALDQFENRGIVEPGLDVTAHAIGPDKRHDFQLGPLRLGQFQRALVGAAVRNDADDSVAAENLAYLIERVEGCRFLIIVQVSIENFNPLLSANGANAHRHNSERSGENPTNSHICPL